MTNKEWLATLTDDEFVIWLLSDEDIDFSQSPDENGFYKYMEPTPRFQSLFRMGTNSRQFIKEWLNKERKPENDR